MCRGVVTFKVLQGSTIGREALDIGDKAKESIVYKDNDFVRM